MRTATRILRSRARVCHRAIPFAFLMKRTDIVTTPSVSGGNLMVDPEQPSCDCDTENQSAEDCGAEGALGDVDEPAPAG